MRFTFNGGAMEVGRSCITLDDTYMFDCGLKISEEGSEYPKEIDFSKIQAVMISHAHLDHTGALPFFNHKGLTCPIFCNAMTRETAKILLKDSFHIELLENQAPGYTREHIYNVMNLIEKAPYQKRLSINGHHAEFFSAGHIPGSASILFSYNGKKVFYSGDINTADTRLMKGAQTDIENIDVMIAESTYGDRNHPDRHDTEEKFLDKVEETISRGGSVIIPAFAVGRAQEILMILDSRNIGVPIYLDGMAKRVTNLYLRLGGYIRDRRVLQESIKRVRFVKRRSERKNILKEQCIIITTSGMLDGGPVIDYLGGLYFDNKSSVLLTGYQSEETNGRLLLEQGRVFIDGMRTRVRCEVAQYDFSAHSGQKELIEMINIVDPKDLILVHGDPRSIESLKNKLDITVHCPKIGDTVTIER